MTNYEIENDALYYIAIFHAKFNRCKSVVVKYRECLSVFSLTKRGKERCCKLTKAMQIAVELKNVSEG